MVTTNEGKDIQVNGVALKSHKLFLMVVGIFCCFQIFREIKVKDFDVSLFTTHQVFYESKDGTFIPLFIIHRNVTDILWKLMSYLDKYKA